MTETTKDKFLTRKLFGAIASERDRSIKRFESKLFGFFPKKKITVKTVEQLAEAVHVLKISPNMAEAKRVVDSLIENRVLYRAAGGFDYLTFDSINGGRNEVVIRYGFDSAAYDRFAAIFRDQQRRLDPPIEENLEDYKWMTP